MGHRQRRRFGFEALENRRLLAVFVFLSPAGDLIVGGNADNDSIVITENAAGTFWEIRGTGGTTGTTGNRWRFTHGLLRGRVAGTSLARPVILALPLPH